MLTSLSCPQCGGQVAPSEGVTIHCEFCGSWALLHGAKVEQLHTGRFLALDETALGKRVHDELANRQLPAPTELALRTSYVPYLVRRVRMERIDQTIYLGSTSWYDQADEHYVGMPIGDDPPIDLLHFPADTVLPHDDANPPAEQPNLEHFAGRVEQWFVKLHRKKERYLFWEGDWFYLEVPFVYANLLLELDGSVPNQTPDGHYTLFFDGRDGTILESRLPVRPSQSHTGKIIVSIVLALIVFVVLLVVGSFVLYLVAMVVLAVVLGAMGV